MSTSRAANCFRIANMSSCLRMALAFSTATSSAKLRSSVGDLVLRSCSFISCMHCYSKRGWLNFLKFSTRVFACGYFAEGGFASGVRHDYEIAPRRVTQFFKDFSGRDSVPGSDATHLIADQTGAEQSCRPWSKWPHDHQNHDADHEQRRHFVYYAVETRIVGV